MWKKLDPKKLEDPKVKKEIDVKFAKIQAVCLEYQQLSDPKDLKKLEELLVKSADANEDLNNLIKTLLKE